MKKFVMMFLFVLYGGLMVLKNSNIEFFSNNMVVDSIIIGIEVKQQKFEEIDLDNITVGDISIEDAFRESGLPEWVEGPR